MRGLEFRIGVKFSMRRRDTKQRESGVAWWRACPPSTTYTHGARRNIERLRLIGPHAHDDPTGAAGAGPRTPARLSPAAREQANTYVPVLEAADRISDAEHQLTQAHATSSTPSPSPSPTSRTDQARDLRPAARPAPPGPAHLTRRTPMPDALNVGTS